MTTIQPSDTLWARASMCGSTVASLAAASGLGSWGDLVSQLSAQRPGLTGLVTVEVRNASQGWAARRTILFRPQA